MRDPVDLEDIRGSLLRGLLPRPVPFRYRFLDADERAGRGRLAVRAWLLGFPPRSAWGFAMAEGTCWREHLPDNYQGRLGDRELPSAYVTRRLCDAQEAENLAWDLAAGRSARADEPPVDREPLGSRPEPAALS